MELHVREQVSLAPLTTFGIGGPAENFVEVNTAGELRSAVIWARDRVKKFWIIAGGSNVLLPDEGLPGLVIRIVPSSFSLRGANLIAEAGCNLYKLIRHASEHELGGWEKLSGIPGSIGGAVRGNAGAFGTEIKDVVVAVSAYNTISDELRSFPNAGCAFSYRQSFFKSHPEWLILDVEVALKNVEHDASIALSEDTVRERERRHLQNVAAAGSYFMNPNAPRELQAQFGKEKGEAARGGRVPAGWLIDKAGMKGAIVGGAIASLQHPNYIVNRGGATAKDVLELARKIKTEVKRKFDIEMHEEAAILGNRL